MTSESALKFPLRLDENTICHLRVGGLPVSVIGKHLVVFHEQGPLEREAMYALDGRSKVLRLATVEDLVRIEKWRTEADAFLALSEQERDQINRAQEREIQRQKVLRARISRKIERARWRPMQVRLAQVADPVLKKAMKYLWRASLENYDMDRSTGEAIDRLLEVLVHHESKKYHQPT